MRCVQLVCGLNIALCIPPRAGSMEEVLVGGYRAVTCQSGRPVCGGKGGVVDCFVRLRVSYRITLNRRRLPLFRWGIWRGKRNPKILKPKTQTVS